MPSTCRIACSTWLALCQLPLRWSTHHYLLCQDVHLVHLTDFFCCTASYFFRKRHALGLMSLTGCRSGASGAWKCYPVYNVTALLLGSFVPVSHGKAAPIFRYWSIIFPHAWRSILSSMYAQKGSNAVYAYPASLVTLHATHRRCQALSAKNKLFNLNHLMRAYYQPRCTEPHRFGCNRTNRPLV